MDRTEKVRIAAVGDLHCTRKSVGVLKPLFAEMSQHADILLICGDLTDYGLPEEAHLLVEEMRAAQGKPVVAVLGNHDFESGKAGEIREILSRAEVTLLDGEACEIRGVGFAGAKGFAGGFGTRSLEPWGEGVIKQFVHEAADEALKLEAALARLPQGPRIAVLHYSPIRETVLGENPEIIPFLGSRRLEDPLNRFPVDYIFHGHAHYGSLEGVISTGTPVYNVALPLLKKHFPGLSPYKLVELQVSVGEG